MLNNRLFFWLLLLMVSSTIRLQAQLGNIHFGLSGGVTLTRLQFDQMELFADNYNVANAATLQDPMKFRKAGYGVNASFTATVAKMYSAIGIGTSRTFTTVGTLTEAERRIFFRSWTFDVLAGFWIKETVAPYIGMTTNAMQLRSYTKFNNGIESWGSDRLLNGVFSSWRAEFVVGARIDRPINDSRLHWFADFLFPVTKKPRIEFGFTETTNSTDDYTFPVDPATIGSSSAVLLEPVIQNYRNLRLSFGITYNIN